MNFIICLTVPVKMLNEEKKKEGLSMLINIIHTIPTSPHSVA